MNLGIEYSHNVPIVSVEGEINYHNADKLSGLLDTVLDGRPRIVLLDMSGVTYINSSGLMTLGTIARRLARRGWLGIIGPNAGVFRVMEITGLTVLRSFRIFRTRQEADEAANLSSTSG